MHAITKYGPICELDASGYPVSDLVWKHDVNTHSERSPWWTTVASAKSIDVLK